MALCTAGDRQLRVVSDPNITLHRDQLPWQCRSAVSKLTLIAWSLPEQLKRDWPVGVGMRLVFYYMEERVIGRSSMRNCRRARVVLLGPLTPHDVDAASFMKHD
eukprot:scaffold56968_cov17-Tisochrysis_lutea.AAC.1